MRSIFTLCATAIAIISAPACANEGRVEVRGGIAWASGVSDETIGISVGFEAVADTDFNISSPVLGLNGRVGFKTGDEGKLFATAGYTYTGFSDGSPDLGGGMQVLVRF